MNTLYKQTTEEYKGHRIAIQWFYDEHSGPPWEECDGHGPVSKWTRRDKRPGERLLCHDRNLRRYYDFAEAVKIARRDGWRATGDQTIKQGKRAALAAEEDFRFLKRWCDNDWCWCGYVVTIKGQAYEDSLLSIDSDSMDYFEGEAMAKAKWWLDKELTESHRAACADILTAV